MHLFDNDLKNILPALWYIMHLPRIGFDVVDIGVDTILSSHDIPHNILLIPSIIPNISNYFPQFGHTLIIHENNFNKEIINQANKLFIDIVSISDLSEELLNKHWHIIGELMKCLKCEECLPAHLKLFNLEQSLILPIIFSANHLMKTEEVLSISSEGTQLFKDVYNLSIKLHSYLRFFSKIEEYTDKDRGKIFRNIVKSMRLPTIVSLPGRAVFQKHFTEVNTRLSATESDVCRILTVHRAIAKDGIIVELDSTPSELYQILDQVEQHCMGFKIKSNYIWKSLTKIGSILSKHIGDEKGYAIANASHITAFTDFPIGLAILPSGTSPLCCYRPISYRPLTPLTRALQFEMPKQRQHYLGKRCEVLIAECLDQSDKIRQLSDIAWNLLQDNNKKYPDFNIVYDEICSIKKLKSFISLHKDADILIISAHGYYDKYSNLAGLSIGKEIWVGSENDYTVPPIVLLSSCHTSPRGAGSINVADILLRAGAMVVLGSFVPVDVIRNASLISRLLIYIQEAQVGNKYYSTLIDAWTGVVATNAIHEILNSSQKLKKWAMSKDRDGAIPFSEFTMKYSVGRLRGSHAYEDTLAILREIAQKSNIINYLDSIIKAQGYYPESFFYQMIGYPENIFLYNEIFEKYNNRK